MPSPPGAGALGPLEAAVMDAVWRLGAEVSVHAVRAALGEAQAYTTVSTTLDRLQRKGLLRRRRSGRAFLYAAAATRESLLRGEAARMIGAWLRQGGAEPVLYSLVDAVGERDRRLLDQLEEMVRRKREETR
jgi:predicted transcriptional regulator